MCKQQLRTIDEHLIARVRDTILSRCQPNPDAIILFGSAARDEARTGSDLDLLLVIDLPKGASRREKARELHALFAGWRLPLDLIVLTPDEYERGLNWPGHIAQIAAQKGKHIYGGPKQE